MHGSIIEMVEALFASVPYSKESERMKEEIISSLQVKYDLFIEDGRNEMQAVWESSGT